VYKSTFYSLKKRSKKSPSTNAWVKNWGQKKVQDKVFRVTIAYLKENSKIKDKFFEKICTQKEEKKLFFGSKMGVRLIHR